MTALPQYYPFGAVPALSQPPVTYDIVMSKNYPRVAFVPTEQGGIYQELVEVGGDLWFVTNATWDVNKLGFYQETGTLVNCNPAQNAYAWCQRGMTGDAIRFYGAATNNPNTAVTWIPVFDAAPVGTNISPLPLTAPGQQALVVNAVFNGSVTTALTAFQINVQNVASSGNSALEQFCVNNVPVWMVDTNGVLQIGQVNPSTLNPPVYQQLIGGTGISVVGGPPKATIQLSHGDYVDLNNTQQINGQKTIGDGVTNLTPMIFGGGWGNIIGGPDDAIAMCSGCEIIAFPILQGTTHTVLAKSPTAMILAGKQQSNTPNQMLTLYIDTGLTVGSTYAPTVAAFFDNSGNFTINDSLTVGGNLNLTGGLQITGPLTVTGALTINGHLFLSSTAVSDLRGYFETPDAVGSNPAVGPVKPVRGYGLVISYDSSTNNAVELDCSQLALVGVGTGGSGTGFTSVDGTVTIAKGGTIGSTSPGQGQNIDLSVAASVANALPVYDNGGSTPLHNPLIIKGNASFTLAANGLGPNAGSSTASDLNISFPGTISFPNGYSIGLSTHGGWFLANVTGKTPGGFTMSVGQISTNTVVSGNVYWICVGN